MFHECPDLCYLKHANSMLQAKALGRGNGGHDTAAVSTNASPLRHLKAPSEVIPGIKCNDTYIL